MNFTYKQLGRFFMIMLIGMIFVGGMSSCKSKKKLAMEQAAAEYAAKVDQAKTDLTAIISGSSNWTLDEQSQRIATIKSYNIDDPEVLDMIEKAEDKVNAGKIEAERKAEEERLRREEEAKIRMERSTNAVIDNQFTAVASASSIDAANGQIQTALNQFASPDVPVLIIISKANGFNDYDRPTTALKFLHYLKDKGQYRYMVESVKRDDLGKITELELIKK